MPDSFEENFDRAKRALVEGWADQALVPATEAVKLAPSRADARVVLARAWLGNSGWARAISDARAALELSPSPADAAAAHDVIGRASLRTNALPDAEAALREVRRLAPMPASSALLVSIVADAGRASEAAALAREDAARIGEAWQHPSLPFEVLAAALELADAPAAAVPVAIGDLFYDVLLLDEAKARYQAALAKAPAPTEGAEPGSLADRAGEGLRTLAAGERVRVRPRVRAPNALSGTARAKARRMRLIASALGGTIMLLTLARWRQLETIGLLRAPLALFGLGVVLACVALARRDDVEAKRAAAISAAGGSGGKTS